MSRVFTVAKKELWSYFSSPAAFIFLGTYLLVNLFTFFWVEKFFSRNIADLRPLFEWMPVLLIFLIATLTMKMWSEERRMGTVEFLLTLPVKTHEIVIGKFLACLGLVMIALSLTVGIALSVGLLGPLDWGPVFGAYLASLLLASAYIAIGLFVSSKTENQIVSLISTVVICSVFYLLGSETIVNFFGNSGGEVLRMIGTGSRFNAISRGILDFRDIYYYLSITGVFLAINTYSLEKLKWSTESHKLKHNHLTALVMMLALNLLVANVWLYKVNSVRLDITNDKIFSISPSTEEIVQQLQEPLLLRGYFSSQTHPLLAPLVPTIRDFLQEYQYMSGGKIRAEFVDPRDNEELEAEASRKYSIEPVPFQIADRHSASMVSSYFNIVVQYGDKFEVIGFEDLIEVKHDGMSNIDVQLRNLEYDITSRIKKVIHSFNTTDNFFASLSNDIKLVGYVSEKSLPEQLTNLHSDVKKSLEKYKKESLGKLKIEFLDPSEDKALADKIASQYGFSPQAMNIFSSETFYYYLTVQDGDKVYSLGVPEDLKVESFEKNMDATLKRMVPGFLRTVGVVTPKSAPMNPMMAQFGGAQGQGKQFRGLEQKLGQNYTTRDVDLESGVVANDVDVLLVVAPKDLDDKQVFAIDQFVMKGGTVILATAPTTVNISRQGFDLVEQKSGLEDWLSHHGISIAKELVLDKQNTGFPEVRKRYVQGIAINEPFLAPYPFFVNVRDQGLNQENSITSGLGQITMNWASPLSVDKDKNASRQVVELIKSSEHSWTTSDLKIESNRDLYPELGFAEPQEKKVSTLAAMVEGEFTSFYAGKDSPLLKKETPAENNEKDLNKGEDEPEEKEKAVVTGVIERSPNISRIIVYSSNEFISDDVLKVSSMISGTQYQNSVQLVENSLDWSTQDRALLAIRSRGHFARTIIPLTEDQKNFWEFLNYFIAISGLLVVYLSYRSIQNRSRKQYKAMNLVQGV